MELILLGMRLIALRGRSTLNVLMAEMLKLPASIRYSIPLEGMGERMGGKKVEVGGWRGGRMLKRKVEKQKMKQKVGG